MAEVYSEIFFDHLTSPRNMGELPDADGVGATTNPVCGDIMKLAIKVEDGHITAARYLTKGCTASVAASSMLTEMLSGLSLEEARQLTSQDVIEALGGLPPAKLHSAVLVEGALRRAVADYDRRQGAAPAP